MSDSNPYRPSPEAIPVGKPEEDQAFVDVAKGVLLQWELLRLPFVVVLASATLVLGWDQAGSIQFWVEAVFGAIVVNVCYFLGPAVETYVRYLGFSYYLPLRYAMYLAGILLCLLAILASV